MDSILIKDTTKSQRIELIKSWLPDQSEQDELEIDLFDMYKDYIDGVREIKDINNSFASDYVMME